MFLLWGDSNEESSGGAEEETKSATEDEGKTENSAESVQLKTENESAPKQVSQIFLHRRRLHPYEPPWAEKWNHVRGMIFRGVALNVEAKLKCNETTYIVRRKGEPPIEQKARNYYISHEQEHFLDKEIEKKNEIKRADLEKELKWIRKKINGSKGMKKLSKKERKRQQLEEAKVLIRISFLDLKESHRARNNAIKTLKSLQKTPFGPEAEELLKRIVKLKSGMELGTPVWINSLVYKRNEELEKAIMNIMKGNEGDTTKTNAKEYVTNAKLHRAIGMRQTMKQEWIRVSRFLWSQVYIIAAETFLPPLPDDPISTLGKVVAPVISEFLDRRITTNQLDHYLYGTEIPILIARFLGIMFEEFEEEIVYEKFPCKICFDCGFISKGNITFAAIKASETNGVMALPKHSSIKNPCPFCGDALHEQPREFKFTFKCHLQEEDGNVCGDNLSLNIESFVHLAKHVHYDQRKVADYILSEYEESYEKWRLETGSDAPALRDYGECVRCKTVVIEEKMLRCKGCDPTDSAYYCRAECQRRDWKVHKRMCARLDKRSGLLCGKCNVSLKHERMLRCLGCDLRNSVYYCSEKCARSDWRRHKKKCARLDKESKV